MSGVKERSPLVVDLVTPPVEAPKEEPTKTEQPKPKQRWVEGCGGGYWEDVE